MTKLEYIGSEDFMIRNDEGTQIGFLETNKGTIVQIDISEAYQGNGHGRNTIEMYIEQARSSEFDKITTTTVTNPRLEKILLDCGFEPTEDEMTNSYVCQI